MAKYVLEFPYIDEEGFQTGFYIDPETQDIVENLEDLNLDEYLVIDGQTGGLSDTNYQIADEETVQKKLKEAEGSGKDNFGQGKSAPRSAANNYGYMDTPRAMDFAGALPGALGLAGRAVNGMVAHNNAVAANKAREVVGLDPKNLAGATVRGMMSPRNTQGHVADVGINGQKYSVGLEALDAQGRTTLTPEEARERGLMSATGVAELSKEESKQAAKDFAKTTDAPRGILGRVTDFVNPQDRVETMRAASFPADTAPVGAVTRQDLPNVTSLPNELSRNVFDMVDRVDVAKTTTVNPAEVANMTEVAPQVNENPVAAGLGLMGVSPSFADRALNGVNYSHPERGPVTAGMSKRTEEMLNATAVNTPGGINVTSAYRSPEVNAAVGGAPNSLHSLGGAFDMSTRGLNDKEKRDLVERSIMAGAMEIGTYSDESLHAASVQRYDPLDPEATGGVTAMHERSRYNYDKAPDWFQDGIEKSRLAPTPTPRPDTLLDQIASPTTAVPGLMQELATKPVDITELTATPSAEIGKNPAWDPDTITKAAMTLAGEIDLSKTDINTPVGREEAFGIMSTMDNRAGKYGTVKAAIEAPLQYSTWNTAAAAETARKNYDLNPDLYNGLVNDYLSDPANNKGFTSYHANSVNPSWSGAMTNRTTLGPHTFGFLQDQTAKVSLPSVGPVVEPRTVFNSPTTPAQKTTSSLMSDMSQASQSLSSRNSNTNSDTGKSGETTSGKTGGGFGSGASSGTSAGGKSSGGNGMTGTAGNPGKSEDNENK